MNDDDKRHIAGAIRNNMIHHSPFEPAPGHRFVWNDGILYRLGDGGGKTPLMAADDIYGMDDDTLHACAMGGAVPAPVMAFDEESEPEDEGDDEEEEEEEGEEPAPAPEPKSVRRRRKRGLA